MPQAHAYPVPIYPQVPPTRPVRNIGNRTSPPLGPLLIPARHLKRDGGKSSQPVRYGFMGLYPVKKVLMAGSKLSMVFPTRHLDSRSGGGYTHHSQVHPLAPSLDSRPKKARQRGFSQAYHSPSQSQAHPAKQHPRRGHPVKAPSAPSGPGLRQGPTRPRSAPANVGAGTARPSGASALTGPRPRRGR